MSKKEEINIALIAQKLDILQNDITEIKETLKRDYVLKEEFVPIKNLIYGFVALILVSFVSMLIYLIGWSR